MSDLCGTQFPEPWPPWANRRPACDLPVGHDGEHSAQVFLTLEDVEGHRAELEAIGPSWKRSRSKR